MTLEAHIHETVKTAVQEALARELPAHLAKVGKPVDPDKCRSIAETAEYLGVTVSCVRERINEGALETIRLGKYVLIPHSSVQALITRQLDRKRFTRDQRQEPVTGTDMDAEINEALGLTPSPSRRKRSTAKEKAHPARRA